MNRIITILLALTFATTTGCINDTGVRDAGEVYLPDAPAQEELEDEDGNIEDEEELEDEEENIEDEEENIEDEEENIEDEEENIEDEEENLSAFHDNDTFDAPLFYYSFLGSGTPDTFTVADDVSAPFGDVHDWVGFTTPAPQNSTVRMTLSLDCEGDDSLRAVLWDDESGPSPLEGGSTVSCGGERNIYLDTNHDFLVRLHFPQATDEQKIVDWELTVSW